MSSLASVLVGSYSLPLGRAARVELKPYCDGSAQSTIVFHSLFPERETRVSSILPPDRIAQFTATCLSQPFIQFSTLGPSRAFFVKNEPNWGIVFDFQAPRQSLCELFRTTIAPFFFPKAHWSISPNQNSSFSVMLIRKTTKDAQLKAIRTHLSRMVNRIEHMGMDLFGFPQLELDPIHQDFYLNHVFFRIDGLLLFQVFPSVMVAEGVPLGLSTSFNHFLTVLAYGQSLAIRSNLLIQAARCQLLVYERTGRAKLFCDLLTQLTRTDEGGDRIFDCVTSRATVLSALVDGSCPPPHLWFAKATEFRYFALAELRYLPIPSVLQAAKRCLNLLEDCRDAELFCQLLTGLQQQATLSPYLFDLVRVIERSTF